MAITTWMESLSSDYTGFVVRCEETFYRMRCWSMYMNDVFFLFGPTIGLTIFFFAMNVVITRAFTKIKIEDD